MHVQVYSDFVASDAASAPSETAWMCGECQKTIADARASGPNAAANAIANAHCRRSEVDEESQEVRFNRMMHMLIAFYKSVTQSDTAAAAQPVASLHSASVTRSAHSRRLPSHSVMMLRHAALHLLLLRQGPLHFPAHVRSAVGAATLLQDHKQIPARILKGPHTHDARTVLTDSNDSSC